MRWFNTITRIAYRVRGPNSFWHIDELYCFISFTLVIHGGIDRILAAVQNYGLPSRLCSDKWVENVGAGIAICYGTGARIGEAQLPSCLHTTD